MADGRRSTEEFSWTVAGILETECPVSSITQRSFDLVQIVNTLEGARNAAGSTLGTDVMPGYLLDALQICQSERRTVDAAMEEAASQ